MSFALTVSQVTDRVGLERAATISFDYNPEFDRIILTRLVIIRDDHEIDLRDLVREEVLQREQRLGDIIDSASIRVMKPFASAGDNVVVSYLDWSVPLQLTRLVVLWPEGWAQALGSLPEGNQPFCNALARSRRGAAGMAAAEQTARAL